MSWPRLSFALHYSPHPVRAGGSALGILSSFVIFLNTGSGLPLLFCTLSILFCISSWGTDLLWELTSGEGSLQVSDNLKLSFSLFVLSEAIFFVTFLWTLFHYSLAPSIWSSLNWPPAGLLSIDPKGVPLLNTLLLVSSGITVTWGHHLLLLGSNFSGGITFVYTILLGSWFLLNQVLEFNEAPFSISDSILGSIFLVLTGLHGLHVLLGLLILSEAGSLSETTSWSHTNTELFIWYWHLVDCIWLIVYSFIYWWGS